MGAREEIAEPAPAGLAERGRRLVVDRLIGARQMGRIAEGRLGPAPRGAPRIAVLEPGAAALSVHLEAGFPGARIARVAADLPADRPADLAAGAYVMARVGPDRLADALVAHLRPGGALALVEAGRAGHQACQALEAALRGRGLIVTLRRHALGRLTTLAGIRPIAPGPGPD